MSKETLPVNNLNAVGKVLWGLTQKTSDLVDEHSPGSIIKGIARLSLQNTIKYRVVCQHMYGSSIVLNEGQRHSEQLTPSILAGLYAQ
jgi:hypothetical protein